MKRAATNTPYRRKLMPLPIFQRVQWSIDIYHVSSELSVSNSPRHKTNMFTFKKYPPSRIPIEHWVCHVNKKGNVVYLVVPTLLSWLDGEQSESFKSHFGDREKTDRTNLELFLVAVVLVGMIALALLFPNGIHI